VAGGRFPAAVGRLPVAVGRFPAASVPYYRPPQPPGPAPPAAVQRPGTPVPVRPQTAEQVRKAGRAVAGKPDTDRILEAAVHTSGMGHMYSAVVPDMPDKGYMAGFVQTDRASPVHTVVPALPRKTGLFAGRPNIDISAADRLYKQEFADTAADRLPGQEFPDMPAADRL